MVQGRIRYKNTETNSCQDSSMIWLEAAAGLASLIGYWFISENLLLMGFYVSIVGEILWIWWGWIKEAYFFIAVTVVFFILSVNGIINLCTD